jgi:hypothetical protein
VAKTYIQLINEVHGYMRHSNTETSLTADEDTIIVAKFLNEAKREVEDEWKWHALRATITFSSTASDDSYDTSNGAIAVATQTEERSELLEDPETLEALFWDVTSDDEFRMSRITREQVLRNLRTNPDDVDQPTAFTIYQNGEGLTVQFRTAPTGVRNYSFEVYTPQPDLAATGDTLTVPWRPVVLRATALAKAEIGEEFGGPQGNFDAMFEDALQTEVAREKDEADDTLVVT